MSAEAADIAVITSTELSLPERAIAAMKLQVTAAQLTELASKTVDITAITNADGRRQAHAAAMVLADQRIAIDKAGKAARDDANKFAKAVIAEKDKLIALIEPEEKRLLKLRDEWDAKIEAERQAKIADEQKRVAAIHADIEQDLRSVPVRMAVRTAAEIDVVIRDVVAIEITAERFAEFTPQASAAKALALSQLREMHTRQLANEAEQERLRLEREELARQRAAQAEAHRIERERIAAEEAAARLKREAEEAEARRQREATEAAAAIERKRRLDEELARLRAEREEQERIAKAERERLAEERRQQEAAAAERARAEQERIDQERAAAQAEHARIAAEQQRQAEDLRRQQDAIAAERAQLERQQQQLASTRTPAPAQSSPADEPPQKEWQPSAADLIGVIAADYGVTHDTAARWLRDAFAPVLV